MSIDVQYLCCSAARSLTVIVLFSLPDVPVPDLAKALFACGVTYLSRHLDAGVGGVLGVTEVRIPTAYWLLFGMFVMFAVGMYEVHQAHFLKCVAFVPLAAYLGQVRRSSLTACKMELRENICRRVDQIADKTLLTNLRGIIFLASVLTHYFVNLLSFP